MEGFFFLFLMFAIFGTVVAVIRASSRGANQAWSAAARALGLFYQPYGVFSPRKMEGTLPTGYVVVDTFTRRSGNSSTTYTRYRARHRRSLGLGLRLTREGFLAGVGKFFGAQDIAVGDPDFDDQVVVKGQDPEAVADFLTPARRVRILRAFQAFPGVVIDDTEVRWDVRGVERDPQRIIHHIRRISQLAWFLGAEVAEDEPLERVTRLRREGKLDEALKAAREAPPLHDLAPLEARALEAEMLYVAGQKEEAATAFQKALEVEPDDTELQEWSRHAAETAQRPMSAASPPPGAVPDAAPLEQEAGASATSEPAAVSEPAADSLDADADPSSREASTVCEDLFGEGRSGLDAQRLFEERYEGKTVRWEGTLKSLDPFTWDFVFGSEPGTKAVIDVHEITSDPYNHGAVQAIVRFPPEATDDLQPSVGQRIAFEGRLLRADGFMRNLFVADGRLAP